MATDAEKSKQRRRILCVITQGETGGAQQFVAQLAGNMDLGRFDLHVVWGERSGNALAKLLPSGVTYMTARHLTRSVNPLRDLFAVSELRRVIVQHRPDVLLLISSKAGFIGSLAARLSRSALPDMRVVYRIGGWTFNDPWPRWKQRLFRLMERLSARWKDFIVLNNTHDLDQAHQYGIRPRQKVVRIYNGIDPYLTLLESDAARSAINAKLPDRVRATPAEWLVGTVANLYPAKDIDTFVRAAGRVGGNVRFVVIGDGGQRTHLEQLIDRYDLTDRFFLLGRMPNAAQYLRGLDVFVLPSVKEGFPWALLEAMAAKVPTVATAVGAVPEMLRDHQSGLIVPPEDPERLAQAIVELIADERLRQDVAIAAHQQVITKFSLREMVSEFERLFS